MPPISPWPLSSEIHPALRDIRIVTAATAAVSNLMMCGPQRNSRTPRRANSARSASDHPPSGPTNTRAHGGNGPSNACPAPSATHTTPPGGTSRNAADMSPPAPRSNNQGRPHCLEASTAARCSLASLWSPGSTTARSVCRGAQSAAPTSDNPSIISVARPPLGSAVHTSTCGTGRGTCVRVRTSIWIDHSPVRVIFSIRAITPWATVPLPSKQTSESPTSRRLTRMA